MKNIFISFLFCVISCFATHAQSKLLAAAEQQNTKAQPAFNLDSLITTCLADISADSIEHYMRELEGFGTRFFMAPNRKDVAEYLKNKFISFGYTNVELDSFLYVMDYPPYVSLMQYNVVAILPGAGNSSAQYLAGAHYDCYINGLQNYDSTSFVPGADDNASGTSATLEIARVIALNNIQPEATLKFVCFAAEEYGLTGSWHYANTAMLDNEDIGFYVNMDMISNNSSGDSLVNICHYDGGDYVFNVAMQICQQFTYLIPAVVDANLDGSDSYSFWLNGFEATFLEENHFSPFYHSPGDTVGNCNIPYCTEIAKISCGSLINGAFTPRPVRNFSVVNSNNCMDALVTWSPSNDQNVTGYNVYIGSASGVYDTVVFVTDTIFLMDNLTQGIVCYVAVSAINSEGFESMLNEDYITPVYCGFNEGILIVDGSDGGVGTPTDEQIDSFYNDVLFGLQRTEYAADSIGSIDLATLGRYSSVLWHINSANNATSIRNSLKDIENYLSSGGNLFLTAYRPYNSIGQNTSFGIIEHNDDSFFKRFLKVGSSEISLYSFMSSAVPEMILFDTLHCDSSKTGGKLKFAEVLNPTSEAAKLYWYNSPYDTAQALGELKYKNVGVLYDGSDFKTLTLGFPLYYMNKDEVQSMLRYVFENIFGELYTGIEENATVSNLQCYPNPVKDVLYVKGAAINNYTVTDASGRVILSGSAADNSIQVSVLKHGVYILRTGSAALLFVKE